MGMAFDDTLFACNAVLAILAFIDRCGGMGIRGRWSCLGVALLSEFLLLFAGKGTETLEAGLFLRWPPVAARILAGTHSVDVEIELAPQDGVLYSRQEVDVLTELCTCSLH